MPLYVFTLSILLVFSAAQFGPSLSHSDQPGQRGRQAPVFRSRVQVVLLDVSVLDGSRLPVRGLTQDDFTIVADGEPQKIVGFAAFDVADRLPAITGWRRDVPSDVTSNDLKENRLFVLVLDDALIPQDPVFIRDSKKVAVSLIEKLGAEDLAAVVFTGDNRKAQDFTSDKTKLLMALDQFNPGLAGYRFGLDSSGAGGKDTYVDTDLWYYQSTISTLGNIAEYLIAVPNRRKVVFWISPGVPVDLADCRPASDPVMVVRCEPATLAPAHALDLLHRTDELFRRAQRANVTIYPIDPTGLGGLQRHVASRLGPLNELIASHKSTMSRDFLAAAAANTGGRTVMNTNEFEPGITDIFAENSAYYLIGFEPTYTAADGTLRRIQVKVNRPNVEARTRSGHYRPAPDKPRATSKATMSPEAVALGRAIGGLLPDARLPMKVALAPFAVPGQRLATVTVVLGVRQPIPAAAAAARLTETTELLISAFTPEGEARGTQRHTARIVLRAGSDGEAVYEVLGRIDLPAGRYRLRLAAHNATTSLTGSVFADVMVPDYSNTPFSAAPVVLTVTPSRASAPKKLFSSLLPFVPTAEREFLARDDVTALLRLYQNGRKPIDSVQVTIEIRDSSNELEVAQAIKLGADEFATLTQLLAASPSDPVSRSRSRPSAVYSSDNFANPALRGADIKYRIPLTRLLPGEHLLTFEATLGASVIRRDVRFTVK